MKLTKTLWLTALALLAASCSNDDMVQAPRSGNAITFDGIAVKNSSRATGEITSANFNEFKVWGVITNESSLVFDGTTISNTNGSWSYSGDQKEWTVGSEYNFYALAPAEAYATDQNSPISNWNYTSLTYTNPGNLDLIYSQWGPHTGLASGNPTVNFSFRHMLSRVRFEITNEVSGYTLKIKNLKITNAYASANLNCVAETWGSHGSDNLELSFDSEITIVSGGSETSESRFLIPVNTQKVYNITFEGEWFEGTTSKGTFSYNTTTPASVTLTNGVNCSYAIKTTFDEVSTTNNIEFDASLEDWNNQNANLTAIASSNAGVNDNDVLSKSYYELEIPTGISYTFNKGLLTISTTPAAKSARSSEEKLSIAWSDGIENIPYYDKLVFGIKEAVTKDIEVGICTGVNCSGPKYVTTLAANSTKVEIPINGYGLVLNDGIEAGSDSQILSPYEVTGIMLRVPVESGFSVQLEDLYLVRNDVPEGAWNLLAEPMYAVYCPENQTATWENNVFTYTPGGDNWGNAAVGLYDADVAYDLTKYTSITLELSETLDKSVDVFLGQEGYWNLKGYKTLEANETKLTVNLSEFEYNEEFETTNSDLTDEGLVYVMTDENTKWTREDSGTTYYKYTWKNKTFTLNDIHLIIIKTNGWCQGQTIKVKNFYIQ